MSGILKKFFSGRSSRWLLHGSQVNLTTALQPRSPRRRSSQAAFNQRGVYATDHLLIAILYALLATKYNCWGWTIEADQATPIEVVASGRLSVKTGYLYVVPKQSFRRVGVRSVWRSRVPVVPVAREVIPAHFLRGLEKAGVIRMLKDRAA